MRISMLFQQIVSFPAVSNNNRALQNIFTHKKKGSKKGVKSPFDPCLVN
jgi:hypothetical protein